MNFCREMEKLIATFVAHMHGSVSTTHLWFRASTVSFTNAIRVFGNDGVGFVMMVFHRKIEKHDPTFLAKMDGGF